MDEIQNLSKEKKKTHAFMRLQVLMCDKFSAHSICSVVIVSRKGRKLSSCSILLHIHAILLHEKRSRNHSRRCWAVQSKKKKKNVQIHTTYMQYHIQNRKRRARTRRVMCIHNTILIISGRKKRERSERNETEQSRMGHIVKHRTWKK